MIQADALTGLQNMPRAEFTGIIMTSFLEHEIRPKEVLQAAKHVLRRDGRVIIKVPNYDSWNRHLRGKSWCGFRFPDHVNYFTPERMVRLVSESHFRPIQFGLLDRMPTSDNMWLVAEPV